jgi:hypothetical protein
MRPRTRQATPPKPKNLDDERDEGGNFAHVTCVIVSKPRPKQLLFFANSNDRSREIERNGDEELAETAEGDREAQKAATGF